MKAIALLLLLAACPQNRAIVGAQSNVDVPTDSAARCTSMCTSIGLSLDSVVVMLNTVGCVCRAASSAPPAGATAGGATSVMIQIASQAQAQQRQQQQRR